MGIRSILGLDKLNRKLARLPIVAQQRIREAMESYATEIVASMKTLVSVDSGDLRDSIAWTWGKAPKGALALASVKQTGTENTLTIYAGNSEAYYARWVEFGTAPHNVARGGGTKLGKLKAYFDGGIQHPGTSPQPFFFVTWRANKRRVKGGITRAINKAAKEVAAGG